MTIQDKLSELWASTGDTGTDVTTVKWGTGWVEQIPSFQNFNYVLQVVDGNILHLAEEGTFDWEDDIAYTIGADVLGSDGIRYFCVTAHTNQDPTADSTNSYWTLAPQYGSNTSTHADGMHLNNVHSGVLTNWTGQSMTITAGTPMIMLQDTSLATEDIGFLNANGTACIAELGTAGPDGRDLSKDAGNTYRIFHEGHQPDVSEVTNAVEESPAGALAYARKGGGWSSTAWSNGNSLQIPNGTNIVAKSTNNGIEATGTGTTNAVLEASVVLAGTASIVKVRNNLMGASFRVTHGQTNAFIRQTDAAGTTAEDVWIQMAQNGGVTVNYNDAERLVTTSAGGTLTGTWTATDIQATNINDRLDALEDTTAQIATVGTGSTWGKTSIDGSGREMTMIAGQVTYTNANNSTQSFTFPNGGFPNGCISVVVSLASSWHTISNGPIVIQPTGLPTSTGFTCARQQHDGSGSATNIALTYIAMGY